MANIASAKKRAKQSAKRRAHNVGLRSELRTMIKKVRKSIEAGDKKAAMAEFQSS
ncbi:MAG: 30S ribosomal protein S20, partial [Betaproteobacteria bacterium SG8_40]